MISEDNQLKIIVALVDSLDMKAMNVKYPTPKEIRRKPYDPKYMQIYMDTIMG